MNQLRSEKRAQVEQARESVKEKPKAEGASQGLEEAKQLKELWRRTPVSNRNWRVC